MRKESKIHVWIYIIIACMVVGMTALFGLASSGSGTIRNNMTGETFETIQQAIDDANAADEIIVSHGTFYGSINVTKQLILTGIDKPVIDADGNDSAINILSNYITVKGFVVRGYQETGIMLVTGYSKIIENDLQGGDCAISLENTSRNSVERNVISNSSGGICLNSSSSNDLLDNDLSNNAIGIKLSGSNINKIADNNVSSNDHGISLALSKDNKFYNNVFNNTDNVQADTLSNKWNLAMTSGTNIVGGRNKGGNFWAHPNGTGFSETCDDENRDNICDSIFALNEQNIDNLPLAVPDLTPPMSVTNLGNLSFASNYINWSWIDPIDPDFDHVDVYLDGVLMGQVLKGVQYYNASVAPGTHTIGVQTFDTSGNMNATVKTHTTTTILPTTRLISGKVIDSVTEEPIAGVRVKLNTGPSIVTDSSGLYSFAVTEGVYTLTSVMSDSTDIRYYTNSTTVSTIGEAEITQDINLVKKPTGTISGFVTGI